MDSLDHNDIGEEENIPQRPMHDYVSAVNNIELPNLELDDSDIEDGDLEPLVYHPVLDCSQKTNGCTTNISCAADVSSLKHSSDIVDVKSDDIPKTTVELASPHSDIINSNKQDSEVEDGRLIKLTNANLAEMELDNAILSLAPSHSLDVSLSQHYSSLSDSNSSGSSLLGKLEETMTVLKKESELEDGEIKGKLTDTQAKSKSALDSNDEPGTIKLDLRLQKSTDSEESGSIEMTTNRCVLQRYAS